MLEAHISQVQPKAVMLFPALRVQVHIGIPQACYVVLITYLPAIISHYSTLVLTQSFSRILSLRHESLLIIKTTLTT
jgi:hypothetical protein